MNWQALNNDPIVQLTGIILAVTFVVSIIAEYALSKWRRKNYVSSRFLIINLLIALLQQLTDLLNKGLFLFGFMYVQTHWSVQYLFGIPEIKPGNILPKAISYIAVIIIADFCQYWLHRFSHQVNIMWAGHITHHSNTEYNLSVAVRQSAIEGIYTWVFFLPLAFLGIPWQIFVAAYAVSLLWQFLVHTRFIHKMGILEKIMSTPSHHRVHHGVNKQYIDKNYGAFFIVWDKLFNTFEPEVEEVQYGISKPLSNENPVWTNVHYYVHIFKTLWQAKTLNQKLKVIFGSPAFVPDSVEQPINTDITELVFIPQSVEEI